MIDVEHILEVFNRHQVQYLMIGGMNFLLRHKGMTTYDVDFWIHDTAENRSRCEAALAELQVEWGVSDDDWGPVATKSAGWLERQSMFCLLSPFGAIDIFRFVTGLNDWQQSHEQAVSERTREGTPYLGLSDADMLKCQYALDPAEQKAERVATLEGKLKNGT